MTGVRIMRIMCEYKNIVQEGEKRVMDMIKTVNFTELTITEMSEIDGGGLTMGLGAVVSIFNGILMLLVNKNEY